MRKGFTNFKGVLSGLKQFLAIENPSKMIKNTFYFILKTLFLSPMYLNFCNEFLFMQKNSLIRKLRLISKLMKLHLGEQTIAIDILPNILRSKCNQTMKFDQLIEYNMRNIFLEKSYTQCVGDTIP